MADIKTPQIPSINSIDEPIKKVLSPMKEIMEIREGRIAGKANKNVTWQDLVDLGLITSNQIPR